MPRRWHQVGGSISAGDGGKQARSPGRARRKPLKPLGNAGLVRCDRGDYARMLFYFACEAAGASRARHSLRPLFLRGEWIVYDSGASRCEIVEVCAIVTDVIARSEATKQSIFDLAMPSHGL